MAIPAMITEMGKQQASYGAAVGQSLIKLGQEVGQQLAMREYQKQAAAELPFIQESMKTAFGKIQGGDVAGGYMDAIAALPFGSQNPIVQAAANNYFKGISQAADLQQSSMWADLQRQRMGGGGTGGETEVVYETPTAEQMADPNYRPVARVVPKTTPTRGGGMGAGFGDGTPEEQALAIDQETPLPGMEARFEDTVSEMDTTGGGGFGFGWSYEEGYRPTTEKRKSFEREYNDFLNAPVEEQQAIKDSVQVPQESIPEGQQTIPFRMALDPNIVGIAGPKSSVEVEKITQVFKDGSQEDRRELIKKDPLAATINDLQKADNKISSDNTLLNIHKQVNGDYGRVTTAREMSAAKPEEDRFKIFVDGTEVPDVFTDSVGAEAIGIMKAKEVAAKEGKYKFVTGQPTEAAPAAGAPQERFPEKTKSPQAQPAAPTTPPRELSLAEQISATATAPEPSAPAAPRKQPERRGATAARESQRLNKERDELRKALYEVTSRGVMRGLKKGLDPENPIVKQGIERLKEIEKELSSL